MLTLLDFSPKELREMLSLAGRIKKNKKKYGKTMQHKTLAMLFQKTSTRTRVSFEAGMTQLGGHGLFLDWRTTQLGMSDLGDEGKVISSMVDIMMARLKKHKDLVSLASNCGVPLINGLCEKFHPCQILTDLFTIKEHKKNLKGLTLVYFGIQNNVSNSLVIGCTKLGMDVILCTPEKDPDCKSPRINAYMADMKKKGRLEITTDVKKAAKQADVLYTDSWVNMEFFTDPHFKKEKARRERKFMPYQLNKKLLKWAKRRVLVMHDMPMHKGYEIGDKIPYVKQSVIFQQAENRMHMQKGIMLWLLGKR